MKPIGFDLIVSKEEEKEHQSAQVKDGVVKYGLVRDGVDSRCGLAYLEVDGERCRCHWCVQRDTVVHHHATYI